MARPPPPRPPAGIVLPPLPGRGWERGSSRSGSHSPSSSPGSSGDAESAAIDAAVAAEAGEGGGGSSAPASPGRSRGSKKDVVDAIASGMQRGGMQPGMVRPPAMVTGARGCLEARQLGCGGRGVGGCMACLKLLPGLNVHPPAAVAASILA